MVAACTYATALTLLKRPIPSMQCKVAAGPAILTGALWSLGNFLSIYAVEYLGLSLGWPIVQCQLIISSLWCAKLSPIQYVLDEAPSLHAVASC